MSLNRIVIRGHGCQIRSDPIEFALRDGICERLGNGRINAPPTIDPEKHRQGGNKHKSYNSHKGLGRDHFFYNAGR